MIWKEQNTLSTVSIKIVIAIGDRKATIAIVIGDRDQAVKNLDSSVLSKVFAHEVKICL